MDERSENPLWPSDEPDPDEPAAEHAAAERLLDKLRRFVREDLDVHERVMFAALLAPGVAEAYGTDDVEGFADAQWTPMPLPEHLVRVVRSSGLEGVHDDG